MCGYCTESAVISDLLGRLKGDVLETHEPLFYPIHLQEAADWRKELGSWQSHDHPRGSLIALCRQWSERIAGKVPMPLGEALAPDALVELQSWLTTLDYPPEWQWMLCKEGVLPNHLAIEMARANLDVYINALIESSRSDAIDWDHETQHKCFLGVSTAFDVVAQCAADDERLRLLAILSPAQPPAFDALALWLQRRALHTCVARSGVCFVKEHLNELRVEAILSVVMGDLLTRDDLLELQAWLQGRSNKSMDVGLDDLLEALEAKANRLAGQPRQPPGGKM